MLKSRSKSSLLDPRFWHKNVFRILGSVPYLWDTVSIPLINGGCEEILNFHQSPNTFKDKKYLNNRSPLYLKLP